MEAPTSTSWTLLRKLGESPVDGQAWESFALRYGPAVFQWCRQERGYESELMGMARMRASQRVEVHTWEMFRLVALEGLPGAEVARRLNLRVATAYVARSKVPRMIQEEMRTLEDAQQVPEQQ